jgi:Cu+-exporting ATPase
MPEDYPTGGFFAVTVLVVTYYVFSRWFALLVRTHNSHSVKKLLELQPDTVQSVRNGVEHEVPLKDVAVGDLIRIKPGERVPLDGRVVSGRSAVDESLVTGESMPEEKLQGDEVVGGSINGKGLLIVEVTQVGENTFLQKVIHSIEDARALKPGILDLVGRVLKVYVPSVLAFAVLAGVFWIVVPTMSGHNPDFNRALFAVLSVLIMAYPCAVGMAAPLALVRGAGEAAERGIVMRTGEAFHAFGAVNHIILDKTGTLTEGAFTVREVEAIGDRDQLLALAAAAEISSEHPVGTAIVSAARERGLLLPNTEEFQSVTGQGIHVTIDGSAVVVGRPSFIAEQVGKVNPFRARVTELEEAGRTVVVVGRENEFLGLIALGDEIRAGTRDVVEEMKRQGITPVLVTGDNYRTAQRVAGELGIADVRAEVLPNGKADIVRSLQRQGRVAMVGDGINDAPALTQADVGIAMGAGADIAIESSDIIIVGNRLDAVLIARDIGIRSYRRTKQNVVLAFLFNGIGVPLAATGLLYPIWAMAAMIVSVTAVLANSMRGKWSVVFSTIRHVATSGRGLQQGKESAPKDKKE